MAKTKGLLVLHSLGRPRAARGRENDFNCARLCPALIPNPTSVTFRPSKSDCPSFLPDRVFSCSPDCTRHPSLPISDVTILLSLTVFLNTVSESMPATSDAVPLISKEVLQGIQSPDSFSLVNLVLHTLKRDTKRFGDRCRPSRALVFSFGVLTRNYVCVKWGVLWFYFSSSFPIKFARVRFEFI